MMVETTRRLHSDGLVPTAREINFEALCRDYIGGCSCFRRQSNNQDVR